MYAVIYGRKKGERMLEAKLDYLFREEKSEDLIDMYGQCIERRDKQGYFSLEGKMTGEVKKLLGEELTRRGRQADLLAASLLHEVREATAEDLQELADNLSKLTLPGGSLVKDGYSYTEHGDPCDERTEPFDTFILLLLAAANDLKVKEGGVKNLEEQ